jgi:MFS family permease
MTTVSSAGWRARAGHLFCDCFADTPPSVGSTRSSDASVVKIGTAYGFSVLSQVVTISTIPIASASLAPESILIGAPYAAMLTGALLATFPASYLMDTFGRRAALALGASLGLAGGCIAAWGIAWNQFAGLTLGSFWLGLAQGFGLFYRHLAALGIGARAVGWVLGCGCLAAITAPTLLALTQRAAGPFAPAGAALLAGLASLATLVCAVSLPAATSNIAPVSGSGNRSDFIMATAFGAFAWFLMTAVMGSAPVLMIGCGVAAAAAATPIAWHVLAMYLPAALATIAIETVGGVGLCLIGVTLISFAAGLMLLQGSVLGFTVALIGAGCGWSLATLGSTVWLHNRGVPSRACLALHDFCLFAAAISGALFTRFAA